MEKIKEKFILKECITEKKNRNLCILLKIV